MTDAIPTTPDGLARRAVEMFLTLVRRGTALAVGTLVVVTLICVGGFVLGLVALTGSGRSMWIVIGGFAAFAGIGAVVLAIFRLWLVKRSALVLFDEFRRLLEGDRGTERMVIETIEATDDVQAESAVVMSRQFFTMRDSLEGKTAQFVALAYALRAMTSFPFLMLFATMTTLGFLAMSMLFVASLAF